MMATKDFEMDDIETKCEHISCLRSRDRWFWYLSGECEHGFEKQMTRTILSVEGCTAHTMHLVNWYRFYISYETDVLLAPV